MYIPCKLIIYCKLLRRSIISTKYFQLQIVNEQHTSFKNTIQKFSVALCSELITELILQNEMDFYCV